MFQNATKASAGQMNQLMRSRAGAPAGQAATGQQETDEATKAAALIAQIEQSLTDLKDLIGGSDD